MKAALTTIPRAEPTPVEQAERANRALDIRTGRVRIPLACPTCYSSSLNSEDNAVRCIACGRDSTIPIVKRIRQQRYRRFILDGTL